MIVLNLICHQCKQPYSIDCNPAYAFFYVQKNMKYICDKCSSQEVDDPKQMKFNFPEIQEKKK